jgi:Bacterial PH domain/Short C-terminal domain
VARYADKLLAQGEHVALRGRQHFLATLMEGRVAWAIFIAAIVLLILDAQLAPNLLRDAFSWLALALLLIGLVWLGQIYLNWYMQDYLVTNRRVLKVEGVLKKRSADSSLEKINDAVLEQSVFGRMFGYGDLDILTANEQSVDRYRMLAQAQTFKRTMLEEKHKLEQDVFQIPAPPLRAAPLVPAPAAAVASGDGSSMAAPVAVGQREMSSEEITGALGDLADLRDRGAISPEEYEAKKQDLLGRL